MYRLLSLMRQNHNIQPRIKKPELQENHSPQAISIRLLKKTCQKPDATFILQLLLSLAPPPTNLGRFSYQNVRKLLQDIPLHQLRGGQAASSARTPAKSLSNSRWRYGRHKGRTGGCAVLFGGQERDYLSDKTSKVDEDIGVDGWCG